METMKSILTKEKIDRQLSVQSSTMTSFMKGSESYDKTTSKKAVSFNTQDRSDKKIDNLTSMMGKLTAKVDKIDK